jgi:microcystin-dependent protein
MAQGYAVPIPQRLVKDGDGGLVPAVGWKITTYVGGTVTPVTTYSDATLLSANLNPIITDADGFFRCYVAAGVIVKFAVTDENDVPQAQYSFDNEEAMVDPSSADPSVTAVPTGGIVLYGASSAPTGFLLCDGSIVARATYADLFSIIGTTYGAGNGSTTFGLPDLRGRFPLGLAASGTGAVLGETGGLIDHVHTGPSHTHDVVVTRDGWGQTLNSPSTSGRLNTGFAAGTGQFSSSYQPTADLTVTSAAGGTGNTGTANPPYQTFTYIIKT